MARHEITLEELSKIPFIDTANLNGRYLATTAFFYENKWRFWIGAGGKLVEMQAWPAESSYFAIAPALPKDICFTFLNFFVQHASFPSIQKLVSGIQDDIYNISSSFSKISKLHELKDLIGDGLRRMITTEIEYLIFLCRSLFDLLQEIVSKLWGLIDVYDASNKKKQLRETFSGMIFFDKQISTADQIIDRFNTPKELAEYYVRHSKFFETLKELRDNIIHGGTAMPTIFTDGDVLYVQSSIKPFDRLMIWEPEEINANGLAPLKPFLDVMVRRTFLACEDLSNVFTQLIELPPAIVPGMNYYLRGYFDESFLQDLINADRRIQRLDNSETI